MRVIVWGDYGNTETSHFGSRISQWCWQHNVATEWVSPCGAPTGRRQLWSQQISAYVSDYREGDRIVYLGTPPPVVAALHTELIIPAVLLLRPEDRIPAITWASRIRSLLCTTPRLAAVARARGFARIFATHWDLGVPAFRQDKKQSNTLQVLALLPHSGPQLWAAITSVGAAIADSAAMFTLACRWSKLPKAARQYLRQLAHKYGARVYCTRKWSREELLPVWSQFDVTYCLTSPGHVLPLLAAMSAGSVPVCLQNVNTQDILPAATGFIAKDLPQLSHTLLAAVQSVVTIRSMQRIIHETHVSRAASFDHYLRSCLLMENFDAKSPPTGCPPN